VLIAFAICIACFFAMNIGASGTAASMGAAYGGGAIKNRRLAVALCGIVALLGALLGGGEVTKTISSGVIPESIVDLPISVIIIASAALVLFISNKLGIPLSTSEVAVGSLIGVGIVFKEIMLLKVLGIVTVWMILPVCAYWIAKLLGFATKWLEQNFLKKHPAQKRIHKALVVLLIFFGCYEAFAAGMNNVANAIGPLIAAGTISMNNGIILGGLFLCLGAILLGGPVLETNGKKITDLSLLEGSVVSFTSGSLVIIASIFGIPVPLTQATTMSIIGVGSAKKREGSIWKNETVQKIIVVWIISPIIAMIGSYSLIHFFIFQSPFPLIILLSSILYIITYKTLKMNDSVRLIKK